ncbi:Predicted ATPase [Ruania alba]|uniref:Predicted ATPase n=1 Tax=Ruania alba TaxID=648782 RepID=A0A1H5D3I7_9MICO|nr:Predicted ATPase [Ruania alba]
MHHAPPELSTFIGRRGEVAQIASSLAGMRTVTLVGPGGVGKSRLAQAVATRTAEAWVDGVWWVELGGDRGPDHVLTRVLSALDEVLPSGLRSGSALAREIRQRRMLLVLDNCEHVLDEVAAFVHSVSSEAGHCGFLLTSRAPADIEGEHVYRVPPLSLDDALDLFRDRAGLQGPGPVIQEARRVCDRLDRLPLAVELAAGWARTLTLREIAEALKDPLGLLDGGPRTAPFRQRSLQASLRWSHDLLNENERTLFRRLAIFRPGFTISTAAEVCGFGHLPQSGVLKAMRGLVNSSLVIADTTGPEARYAMLAVVHAFASARLEESPDGEQVRERHLTAHLDLARAITRLRDDDVDAWRRGVSRDYANHKAALDWGLELEDSAPARALAGEIAWLWHLEGSSEEGLAVLRRAHHAGREDLSMIQARVLLGIAIVADPTAYRTERVSAAEQAESMALEFDDWPTILQARLFLAIDLINTDLDAARELAADVARQARERTVGFVGDGAQVVLGLLHLMREEYTEAIQLLDDASDALLERGHRGVATTGLSFLARALAKSGDVHRAADAAEHSAAAARPLNDVHRLGVALSAVADMRRLRGDLDGAERALAEIDQLVNDRDVTPFVPGWERTAALVALARDAPDMAAQWCRREGAALAVDDTALTPQTQAVLVAALLRSGESDRARSLLATLSTRADALGLPECQAEAAELRAELTEHPEQALDHRYEALRIRSKHRQVPGCIDTLEAIIGQLSARGRTEPAAILSGAVRRARHESGYAGRSWVGEPTADTSLEDPHLREAFGQGQKLTLWEAADYASRSRGPRRRPETGWDSVTPTELSVIALAVDGLSNPQIGQRLFIAPGTVKTHLAHVYAKLGVANRTELARVASTRRTD